MNTKLHLHLNSPIKSSHLHHHFHLHPFFLLLLLFLLHISFTSTSFYDLNVDCGPYADIVATDEVSFRFIPYYVKLNRCQGKDMFGEPNADICYPTRKDEVVFEVEDRYSSDLRLRTITMENHTECVFACPRNASYCRANETWNAAVCSCCSRRDDQVCAENSRWNEDLCMCEPIKGSVPNPLPTVLPARSEPFGMEVKYIIVIVVAESIILTAVSFLIFRLCCSKKSKERRKKEKEEKERVRSDDPDTNSTRSTVVTNGSSLVNNRDSFTYNVDKEQRRFVVSGGQGNFITTVH